MGGYLGTYGAGEEKREAVIRKIAIWAGVALLVTVVLLFIFKFVIPNRGEQKQVARFFQLLAAHDYKAAYAMWGCTDAKPCRDYPFQSFMRDWGPEAAPVTSVDVLDGESCGTGVIVTADAGKAGEKKLWVEKQTQIISFTPGFDRCPQGNHIYDWVRSLRYRLHGRTFR